MIQKDINLSSNILMTIPQIHFVWWQMEDIKNNESVTRRLVTNQYDEELSRN